MLMLLLLLLLLPRSAGTSTERCRCTATTDHAATAITSDAAVLAAAVRAALDGRMMSGSVRRRGGGGRRRRRRSRARGRSSRWRRRLSTLVGRGAGAAGSAAGRGAHHGVVPAEWRRGRHLLLSPDRLPEGPAQRAGVGVAAPAVVGVAEEARCRPALLRRTRYPRIGAVPHVMEQPPVAAAVLHGTDRWRFNFAGFGVMEAQEGPLPAAEDVLNVGGALFGTADGQLGLEEEQLLVPVGQETAQGGVVRKG